MMNQFEIMFASKFVSRSTFALRTQVRFYADPPAGAVGASGDAFSKREKANEDKYMKDREREKNEKLKKHIADQRAALDELEKGMNDK
ncbi:putative Mitochondrial ATPase inhibitor [Taphrina deformans PYCC 5710]|uniref:ATPase inhibitor, mitochondrial n=1 Tax=Taphrina deformans (strain PYCC 5710 / ATCC 11124 / CBS 356.35 / IMI 108563 / JCM 9778 / NBRC 8474) TaxID=1097556 RepID=R4XAC4_TAPDE|nr:putative Mitochondrial ATPase inhibitor [Taphrina deformans PYCC 5710]|eukprot:CCG82707.1 putative Mitochondrial ATPase inhibitor [Taphrina deformans PYCC 5710]